MSLIHLQNEVVQNRTLDAKSWSTYISFALDESTSEIVAEAFSVFHNGDRPGESHRRSLGRQRVNRDSVPQAVSPQLRWIEETVLGPDRETTAMRKNETVRW
jgi:hypothetical protein